MSSAYGAIPPPPATTPLPLPHSFILRNGTFAILTSFNPTSDSHLLPVLRGLLNAEIEKGDTYPQEQVLQEAEFEAYFCSGTVFLARVAGEGGDVIGCFYVKPNFPGRCSHICNAGFIVSPSYRNLGVGRALAELFLVVAPKLGYKASMFNLVFESNTPSIRLWRSLGFREIGRIPRAGRLRLPVGNSTTTSEVESGTTTAGGVGEVQETYVDALMFYYDFADLERAA
ncbi:acyl-CoA N-acyltransferase [Fimicolochytrium jonesii]|uniref:acyl-CoA N-acyltransferase n=1 Tax=Fimicolochytrium jonesii TaxID=1396493 RepID=UPI0022FF1D15|nr:acyl-CoA N-acyltransferase [Fimicolochytrium jonesii]KAI8819098.1 acyl-CoA N-acyltransferase [Fimicolochytrium jonesii]